MNARQLTVLGGIAAVCVAATAAVVHTTATAVPSDRRGEPVGAGAAQPGRRTYRHHHS